MTIWRDLALRALDGEPVTRDEAGSLLASGDSELLAVLDGAFVLRRHYFGLGVDLHVLKNAKSGVCPEDCSFCSQSIRFKADVPRYRMQSVEEIVAGARAAREANAVRYCIVTATRGPSSSDLETVCEATRQIKREMEIEVCASLGMLSALAAQQLVGAGVNRFNHNLETSEAHFGEIVSTHAWSDRVKTVQTAKAAGMEACCGGIIGLGEALEDRVDLALALRELAVESIPVNFLDPRPDTPLQDQPRVSPQDALRTLAMFRFVNPSRDIRAAGGREVTLRHLQPLALYAANSIFSHGYLTTGGQGIDCDRAMIADAGFEVSRDLSHH